MRRYLEASAAIKGRTRLNCNRTQAQCVFDFYLYFCPFSCLGPIDYYILVRRRLLFWQLKEYTENIVNQ